MIKSKWLSLGIVLAATIALSVPFAAQAKSTVTEEIVVGQSASTMPVCDAHGNKAVLFRVVNPTSSSVTFAVPSLGIRQDVPAGADKTFYVDMSQVSNAPVTYDILNADDTNLISGVVNNTDAYSTNSSMMAYKSLTTTTAYSEPAAKPEPVYQTEQPVSYQQTQTTSQTSSETTTPKDVRGYW